MQQVPSLISQYEVVFVCLYVIIIKTKGFIVPELLVKVLKAERDAELQSNMFINCLSRSLEGNHKNTQEHEITERSFRLNPSHPAFLLQLIHAEWLSAATKLQ